ncbi:MarC family protein [Tritonibacter mobilis]|uniref:MarC family protein n=1 Tax=Tritonibacter mobilis TaxID=379347 RepID=UPI0014022916|nr:MarC family protein [Tritonibacter mobilis]NHM19342.1 MarC family protein [Tritonibacter mobilis]NHM23511.1 MarC family protein [Tritonibacter mobilis]
MTWPFVFQDLVREFITLFVVIDPVGTIPVFLFATAAVPQRLHRSFALRAVLVSALVLGLFLVLGQIILEGIGLRLGAFQIAGGIILFLFALSMIFGETKAASEIKEAENEDLSGAVFPLAIPSIASPGAILAVVILTDNHSTGVMEQAMTAVVLLFVLAITFVLLLLASKIQKLIGQTGVSVISRVMGLILATVAVDAVLQGLEQMGVLALSTPPV